MVLQVRDYRSDWSLSVNQPVAGNYYPVIFLTLVQTYNLKRLTEKVESSIPILFVKMVWLLLSGFTNGSFRSFFQLNLGIFTSDKKYEFSVLVDRATGGASIKDGEIELMLHRFDFDTLIFQHSGLVLCCSINCVLNTWIWFSLFESKGVFSPMIIKDWGKPLMKQCASMEIVHVKELRYGIISISEI